MAPRNDADQMTINKEGSQVHNITNCTTIADVFKSGMDWKLRVTHLHVTGTMTDPRENNNLSMACIGCIHSVAYSIIMVSSTEIMRSGKQQTAEMYQIIALRQIAKVENL